MAEPVLWRPRVSFCIITNGQKLEQLRRQIESIVQLNVPEVEIIVSGRPPEFSDYPWLKRVWCPEAADNGQLGAMRNAACKVATGEVLVVADDDMVYLPDFYEGLCHFGSDFYLCGCRILNTDGSRFYDKAEIGGPKGHRLLDYEEESEWIYVTGGLAIIRPELLEIVRWDDERGFYRDEDVDFSRRVQAAGLKVKFNQFCAVIHDDDRYYQFQHMVDVIDTPGTWRQVIPGVMGRGIYRKIRDGFQTATKAEFKFAPVAAGTTLKLGMTIFPALQVYAAEKVRASLFCEGEKVGELEFNSPDQVAEVSLALQPSATSASIEFSPSANLATFGTRDGRTVGGYIYKVSMEPGSAELSRPRVSDNRCKKAIIFAPLLGNTQLAYALRHVLLETDFERFAKAFFLTNFDCDLAVVGKQRERYLKRLRQVAMDLEIPSSCLFFHDYSYTIGSNLFRPKANCWEQTAVAAPVATIEDSVVEGFVRGDYRPVGFNIEDLAVLAESGVPEEAFSFLPLIPQPGKLHETLRDVIFVNLYWGGGAQYLSQIVELIRQEQGRAFLVWVDSHLMEREILEASHNDPRVTIITGSLPDSDLELMLRRVEVAVCLNESDPYGFFVRQLLAQGIPVLGTKVGARRDLPDHSGFTEVSTLSEWFVDYRRRIKDLQEQCLLFRAALAQEGGTMDYLELLQQKLSPNSLPEIRV